MIVEPSGFRTDFSGRSLHQSAQAIADYAGTAGLRRKENSNEHAKQAGDPVLAAKAIIEAVQANKPPFRLALGRDANERIKSELDAQLQELDPGSRSLSPPTFQPDSATILVALGEDDCQRNHTAAL
jgi:hypothetical protein